MTTEQDQSTTEDRPDKATSSTTDRPIASGDGRSASFAVSGPDSPATDDSNDSGPYIDDIAPRRTRDFGDGQVEHVGERRQRVRDHVRRVGAPAVWHRRKIRRVRLDHDVVQSDQPG